MTHDQAIEYWFGLVNFEKTPPARDELRLDRIRALMAELGNPQDRIPIVHVAGSKGKGSTSAMLAEVLQKAGHRTGLFTSPHLCDVEERIQIDRIPVTREELTALVASVRAAAERVEGPPPTFFEVATAMAFLHFAQRQVDIAVVEVGLGGRFDATNICNPLVSVITSISIDHTEQLGSRIAGIAMEKAGIVKPNRPVVSGTTNPEARQVIESICAARSAPLFQVDREFRYSYLPGRIDSNQPVMQRKPRVRIVTNHREWPEMELGLLGEHQASNAAVAVATIERLQDSGWRISESALVEGISAVHWPARLETLSARPHVVLDCAHNVASVEALITTLRVSFPATRRILVFAASSDKDLHGMLDALAPHFELAVMTASSNRRSTSPDQLAAIWTRVGGREVLVRATPASALNAARAAARPNDLICITGSLFLAGAVRPLLLASRDR
jgi:dihydrofolate synthase/folylpolyglutamate synthase